MLSPQRKAGSSMVKCPHRAILPSVLVVAGFTSSSIWTSRKTPVVGIGMTVRASRELLNANRDGVLTAASFWLFVASLANDLCMFPAQLETGAGMIKPACSPFLPSGRGVALIASLGKTSVVRIGMTGYARTKFYASEHDGGNSRRGRAVAFFARNGLVFTGQWKPCPFMGETPGRLPG